MFLSLPAPMESTIWTPSLETEGIRKFAPSSDIQKLQGNFG
jgi:hypothetical protein